MPKDKACCIDAGGQRARTCAGGFDEQTLGLELVDGEPRRGADDEVATVVPPCLPVRVRRHEPGDGGRCGRLVMTSRRQSRISASKASPSSSTTSGYRPVRARYLPHGRHARRLVQGSGREHHQPREPGDVRAAEPTETRTRTALSLIRVALALPPGNPSDGDTARQRPAAAQSKPKCRAHRRPRQKASGGSGHKRPGGKMENRGRVVNSLRSAGRHRRPGPPRCRLYRRWPRRKLVLGVFSTSPAKVRKDAELAAGPFLR